MAENSNQTDRSEDAAEARASTAKTVRIVLLAVVALSFVYFVMPSVWNSVAHWIYADRIEATDEAGQ